MIISAITIENFKSIKEPVRIELKPITLLYGPNSVGKSTIIQALHYAREIMMGAGPDVDYPETGGKAVRLGGFKNLVHNHDTSKAIRLKFEFSSDDPGCVDDYGIEFTIEEQLGEHQEYWETINNYYVEQLEEKNAPWVELIIKQDDAEKTPYVLEAIGFGNKEFIRLVKRIEFNKEYSNIEYSYYIFIFGEESADKILHDIFNKISIKYIINHDDIFIKKVIPYKKGYNTFSDIIFYCKKEDPINFIPFLNIIKDEDKDAFAQFQSFVDAIWGTHMYYLGYELRNFHYIGPFRERPDHDFRPQTLNDPGRWANGLAAWDHMSKDSESIEIVNKWLEYLETDYKVVKNESVQVNIASEMYAALIGPVDTPEHAEAVAQLQEESVSTRLFLQDTKSRTELLSTDVGTGISQVLPIILLALPNKYSTRGMIAIEQPELHLHPAMQTVLGDLFITGIEEEENNPYRTKRFLLETHSEHILLRLLRRIRENNENDTEDHSFFEEKFEPEHLSIYFFEPGPNGIRASQIRVDEEGEFLDPWPRGFFNERIEELF